jgi:glycosyltransferase involved in cell wall biosynthesis
MKTPPPKITIAIPLYNAQEHIGQTIQSVLDQTFTDFECIILNDQSTDQSLSIIQQFDDPRLHIVTHPERLGFLGNWNACLSHLRGTYGKLLPHDDLLEPTCLQKQNDILDQHPHVALVHSGRRIINPTGKTIATRAPHGPEGIQQQPQTLRHIVRSGTNPIGEPAAVLFRTAAARQIGPFSEADIFSIDIDYWSRLLNVGPRYILPEILCSFRVWPGSASVHLHGSQSQSMRAFYHRLNQQFPGHITPQDLRIGALKSNINELARGLFYRWMRLKSR